MFKFISLSFFLILTLSPSSVLAGDSIDCAILEPDSIIELELRTSNQFANCFKIDNLSTQKPVAIYAIGSETTSHNLTVYNFNSAKTSRIAQLESDTNGGLSYQSSISSSSMGFKVTPTNKRNENKKLTVSYLLTEDKEVIIFVEIESIASRSDGTGGGTGGGTRPNPGQGHCDGNNICNDPKIAPPNMFTAQASTQCSPGSEPPSEPEDFDINDHLKKFKYVGVLGTRAHKYAYLTTKFFPDATYDLKNNDDYPDADWEFGNWFFGAAAAAIGISKTEAVRGAAVIQQYQDYKNPKIDITLSTMLKDMLWAAATGEGDTPGDSEVIAKGYAYGQKLPLLPVNWPEGNSCNQTSSGGGGGSDGPRNPGESTSGWYGSGYFGASRCWGSCYGTGTVSIIDIPYDHVTDPR